MKKHVLVLWSGGMDSTFLIQELLGFGHKVTAVYIEILNNTEKTIKELAAIEKMKSHFYSAGNFDYIGVVAKQEIPNSSILNLSQPMIWLVNIVMLADADKYDEVSIGYVRNDDAISFTDDFHLIWNAFKGLTGKRLSVLSFPIQKYGKDYIIKELHKDLLSHVEWCEFGLDKHNTEHCNCGSCKRLSRDNLYHYLIDGEDVIIESNTKAVELGIVQAKDVVKKRKRISCNSKNTPKLKLRKASHVSYSRC